MPARSATLDRVVIAPGGGHAENGTLVMDLTVGEPIAGVGDAGSMHVEFGYWWSVRTLTVAIDPPADEVPLPAPTVAPNPFLTRTVITFAIPAGKPALVSIGIYDLGGRLVRTLVREPRAPGRHSITWDGTTDGGVPALAGVYFARIHTPKLTATQKVVMLK